MDITKHDFIVTRFTVNNEVNAVRFQRPAKPGDVFIEYPDGSANEVNQPFNNITVINLTNALLYFTTDESITAINATNPDLIQLPVGAGYTHNPDGSIVVFKMFAAGAGDVSLVGYT